MDYFFVLSLIEAVKRNVLPETINSFPLTFQELDKDNKTMVEYQIRILHTKMYEKARKFNADYCITTDPLNVALGLFTFVIPLDKQKIN